MADRSEKNGQAWENPCEFFPENITLELLALTGDTGGKRVMRKYMQDVALLEVPDQKRAYGYGYPSGYFIKP